MDTHVPCSLSTASKNTCFFCIRTAITTTRQEAGSRVKSQALPETQRSFVYLRSSRFHYWCAGCWSLKMPMKTPLSWQGAATFLGRVGKGDLHRTRAHAMGTRKFQPENEHDCENSACQRNTRKTRSP